MGGDREDLVLVSDLHLGPGPLECVETFYNDNAFVRFLEHLRDGAGTDDRPCRLVILGDFIDFLRAELVTNPTGAPPDEAVAIATFDRVVDGHRKVFDALGRFLAAGSSIDVVIGNHDAELVRPVLQQRLRAALGVPETETDASGETETGTFSFHRWLYHVPGLLYAEHGHQYDDVNCVSMVLDPFEDDDRKVLERGVGSHTFSEAERLSTSIDPCPDHGSHPRRYFALAGRREPAAAVECLRRKAALVGVAIRRARTMSGPEREEHRKRYRQHAIPDHAGEVGLSSELLLAIDGLSAAAKSPQRALATQVLHRLCRRRGSYGPLTHRVEYLERASAGIHEALNGEGRGVPFYVFGHSHAAQHLPLGFGSDAAQYLNTGTWSSILSLGTDAGRLLLPTFVRITPARDGHRAVARLLAWNNANAAGEPLQAQA